MLRGDHLAEQVLVKGLVGLQLGVGRGCKFTHSSTSATRRDPTTRTPHSERWGSIDAIDFALTDLHLHGNQFGAEFPAALGGLSELDSVTIWNNRFTWAESYDPGLLADMVGLVALYESAGGDSWSERSGWLSDPSVAAWSGISIGGDGSVTGLTSAVTV